MKHPVSAMMLGVVGSDGKQMPPYWFPQGLKIGQNEYLEVLKTVVKPWIDANYKNVDYEAIGLSPWTPGQENAGLV